MAEEPAERGEAADIKPTDIVFDCPHCGKSLAIDYRGAGLTIPCSDCGRKVEVPIPEGMELTDVDASDEEQEAQILNLRRSLAAAEYRIEQLESELEEVSARRDVLERHRLANMTRLARVASKIGLMRETLEKSLEAARDVMDASVEEDAGGGASEAPTPPAVSP